MKGAAAMPELDTDSVQSRLSRSIVGHNIHYRPIVGSTMDAARHLARDGADEGTVVVAEEQTKGRGRFNRAWVSPPGLNLYFTVILRPDPAQLPYMNMAAALAVFDTVSQLTGLRPTVKWPNDVRIDEKKLSGILIETEFAGDSLAHALVGIGVNVNLNVADHPEISEIATSLRSATGHEFDRAAVLASVLQNLDDWYGRVREGRSLTADWEAALDTLGKRVALRWRDHLIEGVADSVDDTGNLRVLRDDGEIVTAVAGEVTSQV